MLWLCTPTYAVVTVPRRSRRFRTDGGFLLAELASDGEDEARSVLGTPVTAFTAQPHFNPLLHAVRNDFKFVSTDH
jgi:hypothetical protein